jgi:hypothetical protein
LGFANSCTPFTICLQFYYCRRDAVIPSAEPCNTSYSGEGQPHIPLPLRPMQPVKQVRPLQQLVRRSAITMGDQIIGGVNLPALVMSRRHIHCTRASTPLKAGQKFYLTGTAKHNVKSNSIAYLGLETIPEIKGIYHHVYSMR